MFYKVSGAFWCQKCGLRVDYARMYPDTLDMTWLCSNGHLSKVNLNKERGY